MADKNTIMQKMINVKSENFEKIGIKKNFSKTKLIFYDKNLKISEKIFRQIKSRNIAKYWNIDENAEILKNIEIKKIQNNKS